MDFELPTTAAMVGQCLNAAVVGDSGAPVERLVSLEDASQGALAFISNKKFLTALNSLSGAVVLCEKENVRAHLPLTFIVVDDPRFAFSQLAQKLALKPHAEGISPQALVHPSAKLGSGVQVGPFAVISENVEIGDQTVVGALCYVGPAVRIGSQCQLFPRVTLLDRVVLGNKVKIYPGAVIGSDGFGYFSEKGGGLTEMPQVGTVVLEDEVRIGAQCTVDRGTLGETRIGAQSKLDDHVHVGHNTQIGKKCLLCGQAGIAGSSTLEEGVILGGQAGVSDHVRMGKNSVLGAQAGLSANVREGEYFFSTPAVPVKEALTMIRLNRKLPELEKRIRALEKGTKEHGES